MQYKNNLTVYLSEYTVDILDTLGFTVIKPFDVEIEVYRENILHILMDLISKEITRLSIRQKDIIIRYFIRTQPINTIAEELNITKQTVFIAKERGILNLRRRLLENPYAQSLYLAYKDTDPEINILQSLFTDIPKNG